MLSEQDGIQVSIKPRRNRQASNLNSTQKSTLLRPINDDKVAWNVYWKAQSQSWRREPEIDADRQKYLAERRSITPHIEQGIYPFRDIKLNRADVEWLLATHENGRGPVNWNDESQRAREGLDLRGANLQGIDLQRLPLTRLQGSLVYRIWNETTQEQRDMAKIQLKGANLVRVHLEAANLREINLEDVDISRAYLEDADFREVNFKRAKFNYTHLTETHLRGANLRKCNFSEAYLVRTRFHNAILSDEKGIGPQLVDAQWENVNFAVVNLLQIQMLGEEYIAQQKSRNGKLKDRTMRLNEYEQAVRANRQLEVVLRNQGLNEDAVRFTYRAQLMQRRVYWYQHKFLSYFGSLFLDLLSGYGYKPARCFIAYLLVILSFATAYFIIGHKVGPVLSPLGSVVFSMTSFHGRGFFPGGIGLDDPLTVVAALEAFIGLLIEVTFIATLTQRLFGK